MVTLSIVMPVYNGASRLPSTMESILGQTLTDFELIVVDDGSTDQTLALLEEYSQRDPRVHVIRQVNAGITRALIRGCAAAQAAVIARHDCGDRSRPERFIRERALFDDPEVVLAGCATTYFAPGGETLYTVTAESAGIQASLLHDPVATIRGLPHHGSAMFRRDAYEAAGGYRSDFYFAQDLDLWIRLAQRGRVAITQETLYEAEIDARAISSRNRAEQAASAGIAIALRDGGDPTRLLPRAAAIRGAERRSIGRARRSEARAYYFMASCLRSNGDPAWRRYLSQSLRTNPLQLRGWILAVRGR
jgi:glycosyltransferase involved in cell wall biosynthesis